MMWRRTKCCWAAARRRGLAWSGAGLGRRRRRKISQLFTNLDWKYILQKCHLFLPGLYLCPPYSSPFPPQSFWSTQMHTLCCWWIQRKRIGWTEFLSSPKSVASRRPPLQKLCEMRLRVHNNIKAVSAKGSHPADDEAGEGDGVGQRNTTRDVSYCSGDSVQQQEEEEEDEVETHSEQYTIIISSHHLQQPARKSNPRKWNPTLLLAQLRPPSTGPRNGISAKTKEIIIIVWTMGRIQFSICCCCARFAIIIIIIFVDIFLSTLQMLVSTCSMVKLYLFSRKVVNFIFPILRQLLLDRWFVLSFPPFVWFVGWVLSDSYQLTMVMSSNKNNNNWTKWAPEVKFLHPLYKDTVSWDIPRVNTFLIINMMMMGPS